MRQIYNELLRAQQAIGNNCSIRVELGAAICHHPNIVVTCYWPDVPGGLAYRLSFTYEVIDESYGNSLQLFVERAKAAYKDHKNG
jgi:hypothetical protein